MNGNSGTSPNESAVLEAIDWSIRLREAAADDWLRFTDWLEADPSHRPAYEAVAAVDLQLDALPRSRPSAVEAAPAARPVRRRIWFGGLAAAAVTISAFALIGAPMLNAHNSYEVATAAGERRSIRLPDGSRIELNGATLLILDKSKPRSARLESGEALFTVVHDEKHPFEVIAGGTLVRDLGTVFNVARADEDLEVAVAEGAVLVRAERSAVMLRPGMAAIATGDRLRVQRIDAESVGTWVDGHLSFTSEPISRVAEALSRSLGIKVEASPDIEKRRFTGVVLVHGENDQIVARVAAMASLKARRSGDRWLLTDDDGAS